MAHAPEERLGGLLGDGNGPTIAVAESCSGGAVAYRITAVAGSSAYFFGSLVAYANGAKEHLLGVDREILESRGAVSGECAAAMAVGARAAFGVDVAVSTTGIAGPGGATARKPLGLVFVAVAGPFGTVVEEHRFSGDRAGVTAAAADAALRLLVDGVERVLAEAGDGADASTVSFQRGE